MCEVEVDFTMSMLGGVGGKKGWERVHRMILRALEKKKDAWLYS